MHKVEFIDKNEMGKVTNQEVKDDIFFVKLRKLWISH